MSKYLDVYITTKDEKEARKIADILLEKRLIACANIIPKIESIYWWEGKLEQHGESLLIAKTKATLAEKIIKEVKANHSYSIPSINFLPILKGNKDYFKWIEEVTK